MQRSVEGKSDDGGFSDVQQRNFTTPCAQHMAGTETGRGRIKLKTQSTMKFASPLLSIKTLTIFLEMPKRIWRPLNLVTLGDA